VGIRWNEGVYPLVNSWCKDVHTHCEILSTGSPSSFPHALARFFAASDLRGASNPLNLRFICKKLGIFASAHSQRRNDVPRIRANSNNDLSRLASLLGWNLPGAF
jgi:hypothetical protein